MKREELKRSWERLSPNEETKARMLEKILTAAADSASSELSQAGISWRKKWKLPIKTGAFAAACIALALFVQQQGIMEIRRQQTAMLVHPDDSASEQTVQGLEESAGKALEPETTEAATVRTISTSTAVHSQFDGDMIRTDTKSVVKKTDAIQLENQSAAASTSVASSDTQPSVTTAAVTASPNSVTKCSRTCSTAIQSWEPQQSVGTTTKIEAILPKDIYQYNCLRFRNAEYKTQYEEVTIEILDDYLGSSVAMDVQDQEVYAVVVYSIKDLDLEQYVAVQYAGHDAYYLFEIA